MIDLSDTICALSSAPGRAGIAVVRLSGAEAFAVLRAVFAPESPRPDGLAPRRAILGRVRDPEHGIELDQVLVTCFPAPHSYTGEDVVEISLHGSPVLVSALLESLCRIGARVAEPGEFTMRAFLRGRIDLMQAEAIRDVIESTTLYQAQVASRQRAGELSRRLQPLKQVLIDIIVQLESAVEFVEEDLPLEGRGRLEEKLVGLRHELEAWLRSFQRGRLVREGLRMAIVGRPNVGKSSLFNALLSQERSIVTEIPGTTRDLVTEDTQIKGIPVRLVDTAGVRPSQDRVEQLGVDRSYGAMADADALLLVVDQSERRSQGDEGLRNRLEGLSGIVVMNKSDLASTWTNEEKSDFARGWKWVDVSARTGWQVDLLRKNILDGLFGNEAPDRDSLLITNLRHSRCVEDALAALGKALAALDAGLSEEFVLADLHMALRKLGELTGETGIEDLLGEIFSRFCIGK